MFFRWRQVSFTALLLILLLQLVFSPLLLALNLGQKGQSIASNKGSFTSKNEPFFVGQRPISLWPISQKLAQPHQYPALARELKRVAEAPSEAAKPPLVSELKQNIQKELDVAKQSGASFLRRLEYENWLQAQVQQIDPNLGLKEKALGAVNSILISAGSVFSAKEDKAEPAPKETILIPEKPSTFKFSDAEVKVQTLTPPHVGQIESNATPRHPEVVSTPHFAGEKPLIFGLPEYKGSLTARSLYPLGYSVRDNNGVTLAGIIKQAQQAFIDFWQASPVLAQDQTNLPGLADVKADDGEVIIDSNISSLAAELNYNPVAITNYIRSNVKYEPYFGAQKGSIGCLAQLVCNDTDTASLTIALLRTSGIPARYKHSFVRMPANQVKTLLGVDQVKTAYVALTHAGVSVKLVSTSIPEGTSIDDVDIENETQLALEWTWVESYLEYDERGGNISFASTKDAIAGFTDDASLRTYLSAFPKKQWLALDPLLNRSITRTRPAFAGPLDSLDARQWWLDYFQYQGTSSPVTKFLNDINNSSNSSFSLTANKNNYDILPPALPYSLVASAVNSAGAIILTAPYSVLPATWRQTVVITLKSQDGSQTFLDKTFFASEINNQSAYLRYNGATQTDVDVIASYGGLASTPAPLVQIVPYLEFAGQLQSGTTPVHIGDTLVLEIGAYINGTTTCESQKFSTAGNEEGIFMAFSSVAVDANLDNLNESGLLVQGTAALARKYLQHIVASRDTMSSSLDYTAGFQFMRAIVTQNRSLNTFDGFPTTFDFSGLTMDAAIQANGYSRRDNYKNHSDYLRQIFGLEISRYEGQLFTDVAGLDGISTVTGLQYAYAHPETYTVHTITNANQSEIDGLSISANAKQIIRTAVIAGATAVVPNKNIIKGNFQGIIYAITNDHDTSTYAIGEQVANGGFTTEKPILEEMQSDADNTTIADFKIANAGGTGYFIHRDKALGSIDCKIDKSLSDRIMANLNENNQPITNPESQWKSRYGKPCMDDNPNGPYEFGNHDHRFILSTDGAYFKSISDNYAYWKTDNDVEFEFKKVFHFSSSLSQSQCVSPMEWRNGICFIGGGDYNKSLIRFYWGTYVYDNVQRSYLNDPGVITGLGVYNPGQRKAYEIKGQMYEKYVSGDKINGAYVPAHLGYPYTERKRARLSPNKRGGYYQEFTNGTMYAQDIIPSDILFAVLRMSTPGKAYITYGAWDAKLDELNGTEGIGFPQSDAAHMNTLGSVVQFFEQKACFDTDLTVSCLDRDIPLDFKRSIEGIYNLGPMVGFSYNLNKNNKLLTDYAQFVAGIDQASDSLESRQLYCRLYNADELRSIFANKIYGEQILCGLPRYSIEYYKSKKGEIQNKISLIDIENQEFFNQLAIIHESNIAHVQNATFNTPVEFVGLFAIDIATAIAGPASKISAEAAKNISLRIANRYVLEIGAKEINRETLIKVANKAIGREITQQGAAVTEEALEARAERAVLGKLKEAYVPYITRRGINVPIDIAKELPGKWFKATSDDVVDSFAQHWQKHAVKELEKIGQPKKEMPQYYSDSISFFEANKARATDAIIYIRNPGGGANIPTSGYMIDGAPGGKFTLDGKVVSFWYVPQ